MELIMKVDIYKNLHLSRKKGRTIFSVKNRKEGRVAEHSSGGLIVVNVVLPVSKAGNQRVRESGSKNVHAFVRGTLLQSQCQCIVKFINFDGTLTYDPYEYGSFVDYATKQPVETAQLVYIDKNGWIHYKL